MSGRVTDYKNVKLSGDIGQDDRLFSEIFKKDDILRRRYIKAGGSIKCLILYIDGMINNEAVNDSVVRPLITAKLPEDMGNRAEYLADNVLFANDANRAENVTDMLRALLYGDTLLIINGAKTALTLNTKGWRTRGISEPEDERILQGPREGFDEAAMFNLAMIRRKLLTPDLCIEMLRMGRRTDTAVFICYLDSVVDKKALEILKQRMNKIDIDGVLDTNYIAEQIRDHRFSLFKTTGTTERPDTVAARLLEGRVAVVVDGTPVVMTLPYLFSENFQSDEDYYLNFTVASVGRFLRYICFFLAVSVPAVFVALTTFHTELIPTAMALSIAQLRGGVPLGSVFEAIALIIVFEILKETGVRMPQSLGHALSIVGGLVVGQAAVEARIISAPMLIAVAMSGIAGLMVPRLKAAVFYMRLAFVLAVSLAGLYGYFTLGCILLFRVLSLSSFGVDCTEALADPTPERIKDTLWRFPWQTMIKRPHLTRNLTRQRRKK